MQSLLPALQSILITISAYIPRLVAGLLILFIGIIIASLAKDLVLLIFKYLRLDRWLEQSHLTNEKDVHTWPSLITELLRWIIIFIFVISAVEIWGLPRVGEVMNELLQFLPNVLVAVVIGWFGVTIGRLAYNLVRYSIKSLGSEESILLGNVAKYSIYFFTVLIILTQLGIAADLVKILFTGIVGMLALAGGLAFGLGGQDEARELLRRFRKRLDTSDPPKREKLPH